jgi:hypothetical protein
MAHNEAIRLSMTCDARSGAVGTTFANLLDFNLALSHVLTLVEDRMVRRSCTIAAHVHGNRRDFYEDANIEIITGAPFIG